MPDAFFIVEGDSYVATDWTRGPWSADSQHAGPAAALLGRAIERLPGVAGFHLARFTMEVLGSIPLTRFRLRAHVSRPGRRVQLAEATLGTDHADVALARAWLLRPRDAAADATPAEAAPGPLPGADAPSWEFDPWGGPSYFSAVEWRFAAGSPLETGPATAWMRMRLPLIAGEQPSALTRVLVAADSGNGISLERSIDTHLSINTELTVHLSRQLDGEWLCLDARTHIGPHGVGVAEASLYDLGGRIGFSAQSLLVAPGGARRMLGG